MRRIVLYLIGLSVILGSCGIDRKVSDLAASAKGPVLFLPKYDNLPQLADMTELPKDTLVVKDENGGETLIMKAVKDENGEMVATDVINAALVTARFSNVAERDGKVDIGFDVRIPREMQDSHWQVRLLPRMTMLGRDIDLDKVIITGSDYRKAQLKGYQQYQKFLSSIISDSTKFINVSQLENFLRRNIPALYRFKTDSSLVSDEAFASAYGITEKEVVTHYTNRFLVSRNLRRSRMKDKMFGKYVKSPILTAKIRLDTVMTTSEDDFLYCYTETVTTNPRLRKLAVSIGGGIFEEDKEIYSIPRSDSLTYYISSISTLADMGEKYLTKIISRQAMANTACYIDFRSGKADIDPTLSYNADEIRRIKSNLSSLMENKDFDLDSIVVTASCSPEGSYANNEKLSQRRSESVSKFFGRYMKSYNDSLIKERGVILDMAGAGVEKKAPIRFISRSNAENWAMLSSLVSKDSVITTGEKLDFEKALSITDPDSRERAMQGEPYYRYLREKLYPRLRTVKFDFHLHRRGMLKDTVHTTMIDTTYMRGVRAIADRDYKKAVEILRPYGDFNAAVAYCAMNYNASAMSVLKQLPRTGKTRYMMAILHSRAGEYAEAVQCYIDACSVDRAFVSRGNLDPEISMLIKKYDLNKNL